MEPLSLATAAITFLVPFFKHALEGTAGKLGERAGETIADATLPKVKALYEQVRTKLAPDSYRIALLNGVKAAPEETSRQEILKAELAKVIESDSEFANELERLLSEVEKAGGERIVANQTGIVAGRDANLRGHYVAGRDMTIGNPPPEQGQRR